MHKYDVNRVKFFSNTDLAGWHHLAIGEGILRKQTMPDYSDINDVLELYNIKLYIDNELYLKNWTNDDISDFKQKACEFGKIVGQFMSKINDDNVLLYYEKLLLGYIDTFWELVNNQKVYRRVSKENLKSILSNEPSIIRIILTHKGLVEHYNILLREFLLAYSHGAELLLNFYEIKNDFHNIELFLPKSLTIQDKENIIVRYLDSVYAKFNYFQLIQNARNKSDFIISDKTRLKAKRLHKEGLQTLFNDKDNANMNRFHISVSFLEDFNKIKDATYEYFIINYFYSFDYIKQNNDFHSLFHNFILLFEYLDSQNRVNLVSKRIYTGFLERVMGVHSQEEYRNSIFFLMLEKSSHLQIVAYKEVVKKLEITLENILQLVFTSLFQDKYNFANNARLLMPSESNSFLEKVRFLAPEFESVLKQYKLYVEDGYIDFDLLQISSSPSSIPKIPSLVQNKYFYINKENIEVIVCSNLFFSDQTLLAFVEPFKENQYHCFFDLLVNEQVNLENYEEHQKPEIKALIDKGFLYLDENHFIQISNLIRVVILKDLYENEVVSFHHCSIEYQKEAEVMETESMIFFESSLFSKPEQSYFNYYLNKSEFVNGLDLRNKYLHGTQANPEELIIHEYAYFTYLKLLVLVLLKIEGDLFISQVIKNSSP